MSNTPELTNQPVIAQLIAVSKLEKSPLNARKTVSKAACEEMKASILSHGLMQNLVVTAGKKGKFLVIAGGRRLEALKALIVEGNLPDDHAVPCQIVSVEHAAEMSLAENVVRLAMHPADQFEAFADLIEQGNTAEQVAQRFGVTKKLVEGRMKLARLAPELIQAYRDEKLTLEALMAFTVTDDRKRQLEVFESLNDWRSDADDIRDALTEEMVEVKSKFAVFVTLETYQAAGGTTKTDLFGDDVYLENPELLEALVTEKLKLVEQELKAEGWGWVQVERERDWKATQGCGRIEAEPVDAPEELTAELEKLEAEQIAVGEQLDATEDDEEIDRLNDRHGELEDLLDKIGDKIAAYAKFDTDQMATAGCYAYIGHDGELEVEKGLLRREDAKATAKARDDDSEDDNLPAEKPKGISESLKRDLEAYRLQVAQVEIAMHPEVTFDLLVFHVACEIFDHGSPYDGPNVHFSESIPQPSVEGDTLAAKRLEAVKEGLPVKWLEPEEDAARFAAFCDLTAEEKMRLLAYCTALTLKPGLANELPHTAYDIALSKTEANVAEYWRPNAASFLSRIGRAQLLELGQETFGGDFTSRWNKAKKGELVAMLDKAFANPSKDNRSEVVARLKNWLPVGMAFRAAPEPKPVKAKKSKKAA